MFTSLALQGLLTLMVGLISFAAFPAQDKPAKADTSWFEEVFPRLKKETPLNELDLTKLMDIEINPDIADADENRPGTHRQASARADPRAVC